MNNKGFTLIELLITIAIISVLSFSFVIVINNSFGITNQKAYDILLESIENQTYEYIRECDNKLVECNGDYIWKEGNGELITSFSLSVLSKYSYFNEKDIINPLTGDNLGDCMIINVVKDSHSVITINLDDSKC